MISDRHRFRATGRHAPRLNRIANDPSRLADFREPTPDEYAAALAAARACTTGAAVRVELYFDRKRGRLVCKAHRTDEIEATDQNLLAIRGALANLDRTQ